MIYQLSLTFKKDMKIYTHQKKKDVHVRGCLLWLHQFYNFVLKHAVEGVFNAAQLDTCYLS